MRQYRLLSPMIKVVIVLFSLLFSTAQAGLVIGGTRFAYPENQSSISVELKKHFRQRYVSQGCSLPLMMLVS